MSARFHSHPLEAARTGSESSALDKPRVSARRRHVIDAAAACFRRYGFHAATIIRIAQEAGMSTGNMYRYYSCKEDIIAAIVTDQLNQVLKHMPAADRTAADPRRALHASVQSAVRQASDTHWAALMIEVRAEATRNPAIAKIVSAADEAFRNRLQEIVIRGFAERHIPHDLDCRIDMLVFTLEGITFRLGETPGRGCNAAETLILLLVNKIFDDQENGHC